MKQNIALVNAGPIDTCAKDIEEWLKFLPLFNKKIYFLYAL